MLEVKRDMKEEEKERIIEEMLPIIKYSAYRLAWRLPPQLTVEDLVSVGIMGLLDALNRYEEGISKLRTFAEHRIKGAMLDELRENELIPKSMKQKIEAIKKTHNRIEKELCRLPEAEEVAAAMNITLDEYYKTLQVASSAVIYNLNDFSKKSDGYEEMDITECISDPHARTPLEIIEENDKKKLLASVIAELPDKERRVLSLYYWDELTMKEIGKVLDITEGRVCQLHNQALMRLKGKSGLL